MKKNIPLVSILLAAIILIVGIFLYNQRVEQNYTEEVLSRDDFKRKALSIQEGDHVYGNPNAQILLVKYTDVNCEFCRYLYPKLKRIVDSNPDTIALMYRHIPLYRYRGIIDEEEAAAECVARERGEDAFFEFMDDLYTFLPEGVQLLDIPLEDVKRSASKVGVTSEVIDQCFADKYGFENIKRQHKTGEVLGVGTVPHTFLVSSQSVYDIVGNKPEATFREIVDIMLDELK